MRHSIHKHLEQLNDLCTPETSRGPLDVLYDTNKEDIDFLNNEMVEKVSSVPGPVYVFTIPQHDVEALEAVQFIWDSYKKIDDHEHESKIKMIRFALTDLIRYYENLGFCCEIKRAGGYNVSYELVFHL